jgi:hypothetical protein
MQRKALTILIVVAIVTQLAWFLLPQIEWNWLSEDELVILYYGGFGGRIELQSWMSWAYLAVDVGLLIALLVVGVRMRHALALFFASSILVLVTFGGIVAETGLSMMLRDINSFVMGAILAVAYLSAPSVEAAP